jgi:regulator of sigma E protease
VTVIISVLVILLMLGVLITAHEAGHFLAARACRIKVREFAIGMGPAVYKRQKGENSTRFTLRALPIGGFCDMSEDEESDDSGHFRNKPLYQRVFVLLAGSLMNIALGFVLALVFFSAYIGMYVRLPVISTLLPGFPYGDQIQAGDRIVAIDGNAVRSYSELRFFLDRAGGAPLDFTLSRDGKRHKALGIERRVDDPAGSERKLYGFTFDDYEKVGFWQYLRISWENVGFYLRLVRISLGDIISGRESAGDVMGPVGLGSVVNDTLQPQDPQGNAVPLSERVMSLVNLAALITVNLAFINLLPIPALDGGRVLLALISAVLYKIRRRPLSAKVEGALHGGMFVLLLALMAVVFFNDIARIFRA